MPSFMPQRPMRPAVGTLISLFVSAWIWAGVRATLQMRTSSTAPAKKPAAAPVVVSALPTPVS